MVNNMININGELNIFVKRDGAKISFRTCLAFNKEKEEASYCDVYFKEMPELPEDKKFKILVQNAWFLARKDNKVALYIEKSKRL